MVQHILQRRRSWAGSSQLQVDTSNKTITDQVVVASKQEKMMQRRKSWDSPSVASAVQENNQCLWARQALAAGPKPEKPAWGSRMSTRMSTPECLSEDESQGPGANGSKWNKLQQYFQDAKTSRNFSQFGKDIVGRLTPTTSTNQVQPINNAQAIEFDAAILNTATVQVGFSESDLNHHQRSMAQRSGQRLMTPPGSVCDSPRSASCDSLLSDSEASTICSAAYARHISSSLPVLPLDISYNGAKPFARRTKPSTDDILAKLSTTFDTIVSCEVATPTDTQVQRSEKRSLSKVERLDGAQKRVEDKLQLLRSHVENKEKDIMSKMVEEFDEEEIKWL